VRLGPCPAPGSQLPSCAYASSEYTPHPYHTPRGRASNWKIHTPRPAYPRHNETQNTHRPGRSTTRIPKPGCFAHHTRSSAAVQVTRFSPKIGPTTSDDGAEWRPVTIQEVERRDMGDGRADVHGQLQFTHITHDSHALPSLCSTPPPAYGSARPVSVCHTCLCSAHGWFRLPPEHDGCPCTLPRSASYAPTPLPVCRRFGSLTATTVGACCDTNAMPRYGSSSDESGDSYGGTVTHWSLRADVTALESEGAT
jgi:hypothetical protein